MNSRLRKGIIFALYYFGSSDFYSGLRSGTTKDHYPGHDDEHAGFRAARCADSCL